jgi:hypothetical protein
MDELIGNPNLKKRNSITRLELLGWVVQPIHKGLDCYNITRNKAEIHPVFGPIFAEKGIYGRLGGKQRIWHNRV